MSTLIWHPAPAAGTLPSVTPTEALDLLRGQLALLREVSAVEAIFDGEGRLQRVVLGPIAAPDRRDREPSPTGPVPRPAGAHVGVKPRQV